MNGIERIEHAFKQAQARARAALMPYYTLGFPTPQASLEVIQTLAASGADLIELGVPFSDPLADGPTIQRSTQAALAQNITTAQCFRLVSQLRASGVSQPLLLMGYINPILAYGPERYIAAARAAGADGLIIPDLPLEEAQLIELACKQEGIALVYLAAPTSSDARLAELACRTSGFLYLVSLAGVTGARSALAPGLEEFVTRARAVAKTPLAVGFGISRPAQASAVSKLADGVIIGSALIDAVCNSANPSAGAAAFLDGIRPALSRV
jgi:tryptophan synthase alpha chain